MGRREVKGGQDQERDPERVGQIDREVSAHRGRLRRRREQGRARDHQSARVGNRRHSARGTRCGSGQ